MKKGFTLIELLAVIVILAVIALIATPIILNIIEDSRKEATKSSAQLYVDGLTKHIVSKNMVNEFNPSSCTISNGIATCDGVALDYTVDGDKPSSGSITFTNGVVTEYTLSFTDYTVTKNQNGVTVTSGSTSVQTTYVAYTLGQLLQYDPVNNSACTTGETCYKWRVITVDDTTSNSTITLQMDHNLVVRSVWISKADYYDEYHGAYNDKGPVTALKALETATSSWDDSLKLNYSYDTSAATNNYGILSCVSGTCIVGENTITTNLKARMITIEEISNIVVAAGATEGSEAYNWTLADGTWYYFSDTAHILGTKTGGTGTTVLSWLIENTYLTSNINSGATTNTYGVSNRGYWSLSPHASDGQVAWLISHDGGLDYTNVDGGSDLGVRPVITISKSVLN